MIMYFASRIRFYLMNLSDDLEYEGNLDKCDYLLSCSLLVAREQYEER